jgi:hypothetical protein
MRFSIFWRKFLTGAAALAAYGALDFNALAYNPGSGNGNLPVGSTGQRPTCVPGAIRYNSDGGYLTPEACGYGRAYNGANVLGWTQLPGALAGPVDLSQAPYAVPFNGATDGYAPTMAALATGRDVYLAQANPGALIHDIMMPFTGNSIVGYNGVIKVPFGSNFVAMLYGGNGNQLKGLRVSDTTTPTAISNLVRYETLTSNQNQGDTSIAFSADASFTGSIGGTFTGTSSGTTALAVASLSGCVYPGDALTGTGTGLPTTITLVNGSSTTGACTGTPALTTSGATTLASVAITDASAELAMSAVSSGTVAQNQTILGTGLGTPPMVGETLTTVTPGSSFPVFLPLINAQFTYTGSGTNLTVGNAIGILAPGQTLTGGANANTPGGFTAATTISSQTSGIAAETAGGPGVYVTNQAITGAGPGIASSQNTVASASLQSTGVQNNMRVHILLADGTHAPSCVQSVSGLTATLCRPLPGPAIIGGEFEASFGAIYLGCGAKGYSIDDLSIGGEWVGTYADCPNSANPVGPGYIRNLNVPSGRMWMHVTGRNVDGLTVPTMGSNMGYAYTYTGSGSGSTGQSFLLPYHYYGAKFSGVMVVKAGGVTKTLTTDYTISNDGLHVVSVTAFASGTNNVTIAYTALAGEAVTFVDSSGSVGSPSSAGNTYSDIVAGGADNPCLARGADQSTANNQASNVLCGPGGPKTAEFDGVGTFIVSNFQVGDSGGVGVSIVKGAAVTGDFTYAAALASALSDGLPEWGYQVDPASQYSGHLRFPSGHYTQDFENGVSVASFGATLPVSTTGSCTAAGPVAAGQQIIPCSAQSGITAGQVANGSTTLTYMPAWDTVRGGYTTGTDPLCNGDCIFVTTRTTTIIPNGTVLTFVGPVQPAGQMHPLCRMIANSAAGITNTAIGTSEVNMASVAVPAMGPNDYLDIHTLWTRGGTLTDTGDTWVRLGTSGCTSLSGCSTGTAFDSVAASSSALTTLSQNTLIYNRGATNSQVGANNAQQGGFGSSSSAVTTGAIQTNAGSYVNIDSTTAISSADSVKLEAYRLLMCTP